MWSFNILYILSNCVTFCQKIFCSKIYCNVKILYSLFSVKLFFFPSRTFRCHKIYLTEIFYFLSNSVIFYQKNLFATQNIFFHFFWFAKGFLYISFQWSFRLWIPPGSCLSVRLLGPIFAMAIYIPSISHFGEYICSPLYFHLPPSNLAFCIILCFSVGLNNWQYSRDLYPAQGLEVSGPYDYRILGPEPNDAF